MVPKARYEFVRAPCPQVWSLYSRVQNMPTLIATWINDSLTEIARAELPWSTLGRAIRAHGFSRLDAEPGQLDPTRCYRSGPIFCPCCGAAEAMIVVTVR